GQHPPRPPAYRPDDRLLLVRLASRAISTVCHRIRTGGPSRSSARQTASATRADGPSASHTSKWSASRLRLARSGASRAAIRVPDTRAQDEPRSVLADKLSAESAGQRPLVAGLLSGVHPAEDLVEAERSDGHFHQVTLEQDSPLQHLAGDGIHALDLYEVLARIHHAVGHPARVPIHFGARSSRLVMDRSLAEETRAGQDLTLL